VAYNNPFNQSLDWALQGKYARVDTGSKEYEGWIEIVHHKRGSIIMHSAVNTSTEEELGSVYIRVADVVEVLEPKRRVEFRYLDELQPHPGHDVDFTADPNVIRRCYRNQYAGSFPVVREDGTIINGHKRVAAARAAGLEAHPVEVINVSDEVAGELVQLAHQDDEDDEDEESDESEDENS
jgi:ParB family chromosome partitioning protein